MHIAFMLGRPLTNDERLEANREWREGGTPALEMAEWFADQSGQELVSRPKSREQIRRETLNREGA